MAKDNEIIIKIITNDKGTKASIVNQKKLQKEAGRLLTNIKRLENKLKIIIKKKKHYTKVIYLLPKVFQK